MLSETSLKSIQAVLTQHLSRRAEEAHFFIALEARDQGRLTQCMARVRYLFVSGRPLVVSGHGEKDKGLSWASFIRALISIMNTSLSRHHHLPKAFTLLRLRVQLRRFFGGEGVYLGTVFQRLRGSHISCGNPGLAASASLLTIPCSRVILVGGQDGKVEEGRLMKETT